MCVFVCFCEKYRDLKRGKLSKKFLKRKISEYFFSSFLMLLLGSTIYKRESFFYSYHFFYEKSINIRILPRLSRTNFFLSNRYQKGERIFFFFGERKKLFFHHIFLNFHSIQLLYINTLIIPTK